MLKRFGVGAVLLVLAECLSGGAALADNFGAIATSDATSAYGFSYDHSTRAAAQNKALAECSKNAEDCAVRVWFKNSCGAVSDNGTHVGWGLGDSRAEAESKAMSALEDSGSIVAWACTTR